MYHIAVLEETPGTLSRLLEKRCTASGEGLVMTCGDSTRALGEAYDFIVISSETAERGRWDGTASCKVLLVPGKYAPKAVAAITSGCIVSFGMSARDTITLSSVDDRRPVIALQRELLTLRGEMLDRQEIPIGLSYPVPGDALMAAAGALLILDVKPGDLGAALGRITV